MNNFDVEKYVVGEKFGRELEEGCRFEINDNLCSMTICLSNPTEAEIRAVERGKMNVVLSYVNEIIFLCIMFDDCLYYEAPFNMALYSQFQLREPGDECYMMPVFLVEKETNILRAMRAVGFSNDFSDKLYKYSKVQWDNPIREYDHKLECINEQYPMGKIMKHAVAVNVFGGTTDDKI